MLEIDTLAQKYDNFPTLPNIWLAFYSHLRFIFLFSSSMAFILLHFLHSRQFPSLELHDDLMKLCAILVLGTFLLLLVKLLFDKTFRSMSDYCTGSDNGTLTDVCLVEYGSIHTNERTLVNNSSMNHSSMSY